MSPADPSLTSPISPSDPSTVRPMSPDMTGYTTSIWAECSSPVPWEEEQPNPSPKTSPKTSPEQKEILSPTESTDLEEITLYKGNLLPRLQ